MDNLVSKWHRELALFIKIKSLIILEGNIFDSYQYPKDGSIVQLNQYLNYFFKDKGYRNVIFYDHLYGFHNEFSDDDVVFFSQLTKSDVDNGCIRANFSGHGKTAPILINEVLIQNDVQTAIVMNFASRYIISPDRMEQSAVDSFTILLHTTINARRNILLLVVNKINDLPVWFYLNNPNVKIVSINYPNQNERANFIKDSNIFPTFFTREIRQDEMSYYNLHIDELTKIQDRFIALTEGLSFKELNNLRLLCKEEGLHIKDICDIVDLYKYGIKDNPWRSINKDKICKEYFEKRVLGQGKAITKTLDVIKRAITGLAGLHTSSHSKPKGVLFFAGPTGTGKTETAKTLAEILFGDESLCIRFDMSEYSQPHSDQKLLGAPPGYVGYESGGQLTNAIKKNPFSILLFDEIEKAHPSIFDKFLQILEDGRMTDGQGNTVYFSESVIIFTSNLGIYTINQDGNRYANVNREMEYEKIEYKVKDAIENYFKIELGRPEILNRIGDNIVVYDYIRPDVAKDILLYQIKRISDNLFAEKGIKISINDQAFNTLLENALNNLDNGGRGIGNVVESLFINPLSRYIYDNDICNNVHIDIRDISVSESVPNLICEIMN